MKNFASVLYCPLSKLLKKWGLINTDETNRPYADFLSLLRRSTSSITDDVIREEIFSPERLESYATFLASEFKISRKRMRGHSLLKELKKNGKQLLSTYLDLVNIIHQKLSVSPAAEWFVDNFPIIEEQLKSIQRDLPPNYYLELPKLINGELQGYPRVYAMSLALIAHTDGRIDPETLKKFLTSFQLVSPLTIGELWAFAITLRISLIDHLKPLSILIVSARNQRAKADLLADKLLNLISLQFWNEEKIIAFLKDELGVPQKFDRAFIVQLCQRLRDQEMDVWPAFHWLEMQLQILGTNTIQVVQFEHHRQAAAQVTIGNIISSMRLLSTMDWKFFFEQLSVTETILQQDPSEDYSKMDFATRDSYRHVIEQLSRQSKFNESEVAFKLITNCKENLANQDTQLKRHIGYYLIGEGRDEFEKTLHYQPHPREYILKKIKKYNTFFYLGSIFFFCTLVFILVSMFSFVWFAICLLIPVSEFVISLMNSLIHKHYTPRPLPKMNLTLGVEEIYRTMVVVPTLFTNETTVNELLEHLEVHYLGNADPDIYFALLGDYADAQSEHTDSDRILRCQAQQGIDELNRRYPSPMPRFSLFLRRRMYNERDKIWMGFERKRGKLEEFNHLIRGSKGTSFLQTPIPDSFLKTIKYVLTLDSDTQLPRESARRLIETMAHPLNRPQFCESNNRVISGYGILQPRVSVSLVSAGRSRFAKIFSGQVGLDPYTTAVSDLYQDFFSEGSYTGKGIYDVDIFEKSLKGRVPCNSVLSHDLFEGSFARAALVTDVELFDDYPSNYETFSKRQHRWTRGDWQISPWILPTVPCAQTHNKMKNDLSLIARWKIFDNLRRSLVIPSLLLNFIVIWLFLPDSMTIFAFASILMLILFPLFSPLLIFNFKNFSQDFGDRLYSGLYMIIFLVDQSLVQIDAIVRTLFRQFVSKKKLLEWVTFAQESNKKLQKLSAPKVVLSYLLGSPLVSFLLAIVIYFFHQNSLKIASPFLFLWIMTPYIKIWLNQKLIVKLRPLGAAQKKIYHHYMFITWNYFEHFVTKDNHWLAPDNFQEDPDPIIAHRTSPTNIGLQLLATISAYDFKFITGPDLIDRLEKVFDTLKELPKLKGHLYNWYDTKTLTPLNPLYISTVDSGNFAGHLIAVKQSCLEISYDSSYHSEDSRRWISIAKQCDQLIQEMDFRFLYHPIRKLFSIGFNISENKCDLSFYDLLASESRLTSFIAIAKGDVPQEHWFHLGRSMAPVSHGRALIAWTATMFEYLMPLLVMRRFSQTILDETYRSVVDKQKEYGKQNHVPWGISESGYNARDLNLNYQYGPFGIPGLGLKRGLSHDLVIAPYATMLAAPIDPWGALENLEILEKLGMLGKYGFYEAIDYTKDRLPKNQTSEIIKSFMAHHQGMSMVSINNLLHPQTMQKRFHNDAMVQSTELLLQERIPKSIKSEITTPRLEEIHFEYRHPVSSNPNQRIYHDLNLSTPRTQILSNGYYMAMITSAGSGYSLCGPLSMGRWREDPTRDHWGHFFYIRNRKQGTFWSAGFQPTVAIPDEYECIFAEDKVEFIRRDGNISTHTEILVSPEDNVELRRISLTNHSLHDCELDVTSFMEVTLTRPKDDAAHPAFSNLFVETQYVEKEKALLATRRKRSKDETQVWAFHVLVADSENQTIGSTQYETNRNHFIGRGHSPKNPIAICEDCPLTSSVGAVLDPIFSLRSSVRIAPGQTARFLYTTGMVATKDDALRLIDKYHDMPIFARESDIAWTKMQVQLRHLNISMNKSHTFQRLAGRVIFSDSSLRPPSHLLALNTRAQSGLWAYGISGDLPIILMIISDEKDMSMVRELLHAHEYLRLKGLSIDLVILNDRPASYLQSLQEELQRQLRMSGSQSLIDLPGGVYLRRSDIIPEEDTILLKSVARIVLNTTKGTLDEQMMRPARFEERERFKNVAKRKPKKSPVNPLERPKLEFDNGIGGFSDDGKKYTIILSENQWTPAPWINVIANDQDFGFIISETGSGYTWSSNSRENRLTTWSNDAISDPSSEAIYIKDEDTKEYWSPTLLPLREKEPYVIEHGAGFSKFKHTSHEIEQELTVFVPTGKNSASIKIARLKIKNLNQQLTKNLSVTNYVEWVLGFQRSTTAPTVITDYDQDSKVILAHNPYNNEFAKRIAFTRVVCSAKISSQTFTCDRKEFFGRNGGPSQPASLEFDNKELSRHFGAGYDPCSVQQVKFQLSHLEDCEIIFLLGECENKEASLKLAKQYGSIDEIDLAWLENERFWNETLGVIQVKTPDPSLDILLNRWSLYQTISCRLWARSAFYQSGGAFGFRDQLQDVMSLVYSRPGLARSQILICASRQFREGDVQHWWHPPTGRGVRTRISDDLLWLPYVVSFYVNKTGDTTLLEEIVPFLDSPELDVGVDDAYLRPPTSAESASILEHCARALDRSMKVGTHGIPLMGSGDWNDGMNRVGHSGFGESVWLGWFWLAIGEEFLPYLKDKSSFQSRYESYQKFCTGVKTSIESNAWDGHWYLRAFFDNGSSIGSHLNEECQIDSISQSWAVLSKAGDLTRSQMAMDSVDKNLINRDDRLIKLFTPPFDKSLSDPGYIKGYVPGVRENGGQYTHAAIWTLMAFAKLGDHKRSHDLFQLLNPINHADTKIKMEKYKVEPYVMAADVYGLDPYLGRGGWTWYTGSASLMYRAGLEYILGFQLSGDSLTIEPCIPTSWKEFEITYLWKQTKYHIKIVQNQNKMGPNSLVRGSRISLINNGEDHKIIIHI
ncbi:MAG: glucoamylase family protein [Bacteriovoracaceae bacterium]|nr:glucoamylase family protein [Bacteriovoracaceae bacterium]